MNQSFVNYIKNNIPWKVKPKDGATATPLTNNNLEWDNISLFGKVSFILIAIIIFIIILNLGIFIINYWTSHLNNIPIYLVSGVSNGYTPTTIIQNPETNPDTYIIRSNNRDDGAEFTWSIWLYIKDIVSNGKPDTFQHIFNKGNNQYDVISGISTVNNGPGLYLSKNTNTLRIIMDTINDKNFKNYSDITNIPLNNWFHLTIRLQNRNLDTYVNGVIVTRLYLIDVPKQNYDSVYVCQNGGFSGSYSDLFYYNYALSVNDIQGIVFKGPGLTYSVVQVQSEKSSLSRGSINNYLSPLWYFNENTSSSSVDFSNKIINNNPTITTIAATAPTTPPTTLPTLPQTNPQVEEQVKVGNIYVPVSISDNYDNSGNLVEKGLIIKPVTQETSTVSVDKPDIKTLITVSPFSLNSSLFSTIFSDAMDGDVRAIDKHNIDCSGSAINSFQYNTTGDGNFNYNYTCSNSGGGNLTTLNSNSTNFTETTGSTLDLAKQNVQCPTNSVLSQFQLFNNTPLGSESSATQMQYKYKCLQPDDPTKQPLTCRNLSTPTFRMNQDSKFLSKSNIKCNADEALSGFQYMLTPDSKQYYYNYTCCKTPYSG